MRVLILHPFDLRKTPSIKVFLFVALKILSKRQFSSVTHNCCHLLHGWHSFKEHYNWGVCQEWWIMGTNFKKEDKILVHKWDRMKLYRGFQVLAAFRKVFRYLCTGASFWLRLWCMPLALLVKQLSTYCFCICAHRYVLKNQYNCVIWMLKSETWKNFTCLWKFLMFT